MAARLPHPGRQAATDREPPYEHEETRALVARVEAAAERVRTEGEAAFRDFRVPGSRWRQGETYVFVLDPEGEMRVHPDPELEGRRSLELKDVNGKPIIRGLIAAATARPDHPEGWYHYQWPVPGELLPRWKSSYVRLVQAPSGERYVVGSGVYDDRMERAFVVEAVARAVEEIERRGEAAFPLLRDPAGPYVIKDTYVFVMDMDGLELVNPAFPSLEGTSLLEMKDTRGKPVIREMIALLRARDSGWVDYMWPRPGESVSTQKSTYVRRARLGERTVVVGCGVYLADAPSDAEPVTAMTASELTALVRDAAALLEQKGEEAFPELRRQGSRWLHDDIYLWVWSLDGTRLFHGEKPAGEGQDVTGLTDPLGKPIGRMFLETAASPEGEGWIHCMWPRPHEVFPTWKSCFVKRVTFPSGKRCLVGSGLYNMQVDEAMVEDVVNRAAALIEERGEEAFARLRDRKGPFVFMDVYVFVHDTDGIERVNPAFPSLEGRDLTELRDVRGRAVVLEQAAAALKEGSAWLELYWYKPGDNTPARKRTYVRKAEAGRETYIVGSGIYVE